VGAVYAAVVVQLQPGGEGLIQTVEGSQAGRVERRVEALFDGEKKALDFTLSGSLTG
jgi:hypothetical protein